ncbi:MAG: VWA domain-containing protein [Candidatus Sericytochromatia bacterium]|uniref:VWA domain-containing protein n=1 Tax=Candidatus Tanganyikabacteria bacterium TaxID=2961651 RepID=A0A938BNU9_9BACT|nr:VWA domain-containing protein [Candidatus Tanganyikabacteria bacterium]
MKRLALALIAATLTGCPMVHAGMPAGGGSSLIAPARRAAEPGTSTTGGSAGPGAKPSGGLVGSAGFGLIGETGGAAVPAPAAKAGDFARGAELGESAVAPKHPSPGSGLKGGELDDNGSFEQFLAYQKSYVATNVTRVDVSDRYLVQILDAAGKAVPNATVRLSLSGADVSLRSASNGRVLFFPKAYGISGATGDISVDARRGELSIQGTLARDASRSATLSFAADRGPVPRKVDIAFVLDLTGSMGDELGRIQRTIGDISARINALGSQPAIRYGLVGFRDRGDDFVTKKFAFTGDLATFKGRLDTFSAAGGGDYPEDVNAGVQDAVSGLDWDTGESLRLMFLVGDAPPHMDYVQGPSYATEMKKAAASGIKIFPIAASGLDNQGEYIFRQMAQFTGGKFLYITYGGDTPHHVGPVQDNNLDDLVVGIVKAELANLE